VPDCAPGEGKGLKYAHCAQGYSERLLDKVSTCVVLGVVDLGGSCPDTILRDRWKNLRDHFDLLKHLKKTLLCCYCFLSALPQKHISLLDTFSSDILDYICAYISMLVRTEYFMQSPIELMITGISVYS